MSRRDQLFRAAVLGTLAHTSGLDVPTADPDLMAIGNDVELHQAWTSARSRAAEFDHQQIGERA